jgi:hypothetical protein
MNIIQSLSLHPSQWIDMIDVEWYSFIHCFSCTCVPFMLQMSSLSTFAPSYVTIPRHERHRQLVVRITSELQASSPFPSTIISLITEYTITHDAFDNNGNGHRLIVIGGHGHVQKRDATLFVDPHLLVSCLDLASYSSSSSNGWQSWSCLPLLSPYLTSAVAVHDDELLVMHLSNGEEIYRSFMSLNMNDAMARSSWLSSSSLTREQYHKQMKQYLDKEAETHGRGDRARPCISPYSDWIIHRTSSMIESTGVYMWPSQVIRRPLRPKQHESRGSMQVVIIIAIINLSRYD